MDLRRCTACWECIKKCPKKVIGKAGFLCHRHAAFKNAAACIGCGKCIKTCPNGVFLKLDETVSIHKVNTGMSFGIERLLPIAFAASAVTGIGLHIAGHGGNHETWHNWAIAHIAATFVWLLSVAGHVKRHILWYRTFISKGLCQEGLDYLFRINALSIGDDHRLIIDCVYRGSKLGHWIIAL